MTLELYQYLISRPFVNLGQYISYTASLARDQVIKA